jgi:hypothetical protein
VNCIRNGVSGSKKSQLFMRGVRFPLHKLKSSRVNHWSHFSASIGTSKVAVSGGVDRKVHGRVYGVTFGR